MSKPTAIVTRQEQDRERGSGGESDSRDSRKISRTTATPSQAVVIVIVTEMSIIINILVKKNAEDDDWALTASRTTAITTTASSPSSSSSSSSAGSSSSSGSYTHDRRSRNRHHNGLSTLSQKSETVSQKWDCVRLSHKSETVSLFCDSVDRAFSATVSLLWDSLTFLRQCGQAFNRLHVFRRRFHRTCVMQIRHPIRLVLDSGADCSIPISQIRKWRAHDWKYDDFRFDAFSWCNLITNYELIVSVAFGQKFSFQTHMVWKTIAENWRQKMESIYGAGLGAGFRRVCHAYKQ